MCAVDSCVLSSPRQLVENPHASRDKARYETGWTRAQRTPRSSRRDRACQFIAPVHAKHMWISRAITPHLCASINQLNKHPTHRVNSARLARACTPVGQNQLRSQAGACTLDCYLQKFSHDPKDNKHPCSDIKLQDHKG